MKKYLCPEDEELAAVAAEMLALHRSHGEQMARGEVISTKELNQLRALSKRHAELMTAPRSAVCEDCGEQTAKESAAFLIVRDVVIAGQIVPLPQEIYVGLRCPGCVTDEVKSALGV